MLKDDARDSAEVVPLFRNGELDQPSPAESLRLIRAFVAIADPAKRLSLITLTERLANGGAWDAP